MRINCAQIVRCWVPGQSVNESRGTERRSRTCHAPAQLRGYVYQNVAAGALSHPGCERRLGETVGKTHEDVRGPRSFHNFDSTCPAADQE